MLYDNHGRLINYMRLAVTDRCNLRCTYCMPACGIKFTERSALLTYEEMLRLASVTAASGIHKIRITGGEPFVRRNLIDFLGELVNIDGVRQVPITTNATLIEGHIDRLKSLGITSINVSLDSLDRERFFEITRRDDLPIVMKNVQHLIDEEFDVKINMVVMANSNVQDIIPMLLLAKEHRVSIRFLEEMPFNGVGQDADTPFWTHVDILRHIKASFPSVTKIADAPYSTSMNYSIPGFRGSFGIIASYSRTFCGTCNRIRVTPQGQLKTCLYDDGKLNIRDMLRSGATDAQLMDFIRHALQHRAIDGKEAEARRQANPISESMASIGG